MYGWRNGACACMMYAMVEIPLTNSRLVALVDDADAEILSSYTWWLHIGRGSGRHYARGVIARNNVFMHRFILGSLNGVLVDHKDQDGLNNQRENLRECSSSESQMNRGVFKNNVTGLKGVWFFPEARGTKKYIARGWVGGRMFSLGAYMSAAEAHQAYVAWAKVAHGEFFRAA